MMMCGEKDDETSWVRVVVCLVRLGSGSGGTPVRCSVTVRLRVLAGSVFFVVVARRGGHSRLSVSSSRTRKQWGKPPKNARAKNGDHVWTGTLPVGGCHVARA